MEIELLVTLECTILGQSNGCIGAAISDSIAKLQDVLHILLQRHCSEIDTSLSNNDCLHQIRKLLRTRNCSDTFIDCQDAR